MITWHGKMAVLHRWRTYSSKTAKFKMYLIKQRPVKFEHRYINIYEIATQINITKAHLIKIRAVTILVNF